MDNDVRDHATDFAALFPVCRCGLDSCGSCDGYQLTPRTAAALWAAAQLLADMAADEIAEHGDRPVTKEGSAVFGSYPRITWRQDAQWRRRAARAFADIANDLAAGDWPRRTCPADEMALWVILETSEAAITDGWSSASDLIPQLPAHPDDFQWDDANESLLLDSDLDYLFSAQFDGIEDPAAQVNQRMGFGDWRPAAWFTPFAGSPERDRG